MLLQHLLISNKGKVSSIIKYKKKFGQKPSTLIFALPNKEGEKGVYPPVGGWFRVQRGV